MSLRPFVWAAAIAASVLAVAGCGGGGGSSSGIPTLAGTPFPTVPGALPTQPVCETTANIPLPANFPPEVPVPPQYKVWSVTTTPYLHVEGRLVPPDSGNHEPPKGMVSSAIFSSLSKANWKLTDNLFSDAVSFDFVSADGTKHGRYGALDAVGCTPQVILSYDIMWVTP